MSLVPTYYSDHTCCARLFYVLNSFFSFKRYVDFISILPAHLEKDGPYIVNYSNFLQFVETGFYLLALKCIECLKDDIFLDVSVTLKFQCFSYKIQPA